MSLIDKQYLGDGVYVAVDDGTATLTLTTENGLTTTNAIHLEPAVYLALERYVEARQAKPFCPGCGRSVGTHGDWCNGCEEAAKALPPHDD